MRSNKTSKERVPSLHVLVYGGSGGSGGYMRYCRSILGAGKIPEDMRLTLICSQAFWQAMTPTDSGITPLHHPLINGRTRLHRALWKLLVYPLLSRRLAADAEFYPLGVLPFFPRRCPILATCHNLLPFDHAEIEALPDASERIAIIRIRKQQVVSFNRASALVYLSEHSEHVIAPQLAAPKPNRVIAHGVDPIFFSVPERSYELSGTVLILYVSTVFPYKHHLELLQAIAALRESTHLDLRLVLVGGGPQNHTVQLWDTINRMKAEAWIDDRGVLDDKGLLGAYTEADIFAYPSACETFGIPLIEAMATGLPIACSDGSGLPDLAGDSAVLFDPSQPETIRRALEKLIKDRQLRRRLGIAGRRIANSFHWKQTAAATFGFIQELCDGTSRGIEANETARL